VEAALRFRDTLASTGAFSSSSASVVVTVTETSAPAILSFLNTR